MAVTRQGYIIMFTFLIMLIFLQDISEFIGFNIPISFAFFISIVLIGTVFKDKILIKENN